VSSADPATAHNAIRELRAFLAGHRFIWLGMGPANCIGLARHMRFDVLICRRFGPDTEAAAARVGAQLICEELESGERRRGGGVEGLLTGPIAQRIATVLTDGPRRVISWCSTETMEALAAASNGSLQILAVPVALQEQFEDKVAFRRALPTLGIEPVPHDICHLSAVDFARSKQRFGLPFVVQMATGYGGSGTFFITSQDQLLSLQNEKDDQEVTVSKYIAGLAPNVTGVVLDDGLLMAHPTVQLVGVPQCVDWPSKYCGNDFAAAQLLPDHIIQTLYDQMRKIGAWMAEHGFRGLFGIDFVVDGPHVYPLEINPRLQGSTAILTELQNVSGQVPLWLLHVVGHLEGGQDLLRRLALPRDTPQPLCGSRMNIRNLTDDWCVVGGSLQPGIYAWEGATAIYRRPGLTVADCETPEEFVVTGGVPSQGKRIGPRAGLCEIFTRHAVLGGASNRLQPWAARVIEWVREALDLIPKEPSDHTRLEGQASSDLGYGIEMGRQ
jgi:glutathione synthase/RimK-type ligase-like ATP-grasp enzyme